MIAVVKSAGATVANKALQLVVQSSTGLLTDVHSASFQIFEMTTGTTEATPVQVYPTTGGNREAINVVTQRLGTGRYAAIWTPASDLPLGRYRVRWWYQFTVSQDPISFDQEFELAPVAYPGPAYCTLYDLRAAGLAAAAATDTMPAQRLIVQASRLIEHYTGRQFNASYKVIRVSGASGRMLLLEEPIIALDTVIMNHSGDFAVTDREVGTFNVFNRHIRENLFRPDDRDNPKLEFLHGWDLSGIPGSAGYDYRWYSGVQNVQVAGVFGYTEPDTSMVGATPFLIRHACQLICFKQQYTIGSTARRDALAQHRIKSEYTRDQGYIMADPDVGRAAPFVTHLGDPEIDAILFGFVRPPQFGAA